jgi:hypothetical protein
MGKATTGRGGKAPDPVDSDGFWEHDGPAEGRPAAPHPCRHCHRAFKTDRGLRQHLQYCWKNVESKRFTEGGYDGQGEYEATLNRAGRVVGFTWRGRDALDGQRIKRDRDHILDVLGVER